LYLHKAAQRIVTNYNGIFPNTDTDLLSLPGVGLYTARAIQVFAFRKDVSMIDTNIRKILTWFFYAGGPVSEKELQSLADALVPKKRSWEWHQALMDFGALELRKILKDEGVHISVPRQTPFVGSSRYYRGIIINTLRDGKIKRSDLVRTLSMTYGLDRRYSMILLVRLENEGLIQLSIDKYLQLPK
jgi:A/G-specific adenine glycosylase